MSVDGLVNLMSCKINIPHVVFLGNSILRKKTLAMSNMNSSQLLWIKVLTLLLFTNRSRSRKDAFMSSNQYWINRLKTFICYWMHLYFNIWMTSTQEQKGCTPFVAMIGSFRHTFTMFWTREKHYYKIYVF